jgi:hypothetical protein
MTTLNAVSGISIIDTTEGEHFDMYQDELSGALALCDGEDACCCCCCCCC